MRINDDKNCAIVNKGPNKTIKISEGDFITIDGDSGRVYQGYFNTRLKRIKV
jgi:phosphohistidine swiveling domain-containing protein